MNTREELMLREKAIMEQLGGPGSGCHGDSCGRPPGSGGDKSEESSAGKQSSLVGKSRKEVHEILTKKWFNKGPSTFNHETKTWTTRYEGPNSNKYVEIKTDDNTYYGKGGVVVSVTTKRL